MKIIFYLVLILIEFCSLYDIIPVTNFEKKFVNLTPSKNYVIFSYNISGSSNLTTYYH